VFDGIKYNCRFELIIKTYNYSSVIYAFKLNNNLLNLPYVSPSKRVRFFKEGIFSIMETDEFLIRFDGNKYLKFSECGSRVCGLCGTKNGLAVDPKDHLVVDRYKPNCQ
jgi:hypothetical protein